MKPPYPTNPFPPACAVSFLITTFHPPLKTDAVRTGPARCGPTVLLATRSCPDRQLFTSPVETSSGGPSPWKFSNKSRPRYSRAGERSDDSFHSRKKRLFSSGSFYSASSELTFSVSCGAVVRSNYTINIRQKWIVTEITFTHEQSVQLVLFVSLK